MLRSERAQLCESTPSLSFSLTHTARNTQEPVPPGSNTVVHAIRPEPALMKGTGTATQKGASECGV